MGSRKGEIVTKDTEVGRGGVESGAAYVGAAVGAVGGAVPSPLEGFPDGADTDD